jgi:MFS transporter, DHA1 family, inner membrane transport protein
MIANGATVALVVGAPLAVRVGQLWGWRPSLWGLAALAIAAIIPLRALPPIIAPPGPQSRWKIFADRRVLSLIALTASVVAPEFLAVTYLATTLRASGAIVPMALLAFGGGGFVGTTIVPLLVNWRGARFALLIGACGVTVFTALLAVTNAIPIGAVATMFVVGVSGALTVVPQHHRLLSLVPPATAPVAIGLNGSALYVGGALGAAIGGAVLAAFGAGALPAAAAGIGLLSVVLCIFVRPDARQPNVAAADARARPSSTEPSRDGPARPGHA